VDPTRDDDLALGPRGLHAIRRAVLDPYRLTALEQDAGRMRLGRDGQVGAALGGAEISARRAPAPAVGGRRLVIADAFLGRAVEIVIGGNAGFARRLDHRVAERAAHRVRHMQRSAAAVELVGAALLVLGLLEIGQHVVIGPAVAALLAPAVAT